MFDTSRFTRKSLEKRVLSAAILIPCSLAAVYFGGLAFTIFLMAVASACFYEWFSVSAKTPKPIMFYALGVIYLGIAFISFYIIRTHYGLMSSILVMVLVWSSDSSAYFSGKFTGGPKFWKEISPNKTWAGFAGALLLPAALTVLFFVFLHPSMGDYSFWANVLFSALAGGVIGIVAQIGDLVISALKRIAKVKDTGKLIPGHGGFLDRMDSLILVGPFYLALLHALMS